MDTFLSEEIWETFYNLNFILYLFNFSRIFEARDAKILKNCLWKHFSTKINRNAKVGRRERLIYFEEKNYDSSDKRF